MVVGSGPRLVYEVMLATGYVVTVLLIVDDIVKIESWMFRLARRTTKTRWGLTGRVLRLYVF